MGKDLCHFEGHFDYTYSVMNIETNRKITILESPDWQEYQLIDSGNGRKLERFGPYLMVRPEAEAVWQPLLSEKEWGSAVAEFIPSPEENGGHWKSRSLRIGDEWIIAYKSLRLALSLSNSKHLGIFPEQACQWDWIQTQAKNFGKPMRILNLFGYTGAITMAAAQSGAMVTHLDASKKAIQWAKQNQKASKIGPDRIRWIVDDGLKFVEREIRRNSTYQGIILDPPKFGRGPKGEVWEFYRGLPELLSACRQILAEDASFILLTAYAVKASSITLAQAMDEVIPARSGQVECGEVCLRESAGKRLLPMAVFSRWSRERGGKL